MVAKPEADPALSADEVKELEAGYRPVTVFSALPEWTIDTALWDRRASSFDLKRTESTQETLAQAIEIALRAAAVDTGAIEGLYQVTRGLTNSVATEEPGWQKLLQEQGPHVLPTFEAQLAAYKLAGSLASSPLPINEASIRQLHAEVCRAQETYLAYVPGHGRQEQQLPKGEYKKYPNWARRADGSVHVYAPVAEVAEAMRRFVEQLRTPEFLNAHPVVQAAYAHYGIAAIHPFADGNGRVARALASTFLYSAKSIPLVVYGDQRNQYLDSLEAADIGNFGTFVSFVFERAIATLQLATYRMSPSPRDQAAKLRVLMTAQHGLSHAELDGIGTKLINSLMAKINAEIPKLGLPPGVNVGVGQGGGGSALSDPKYREIATGSPGYVFVYLNSQPPASANIAMQFRALIARDDRYPIVLERIGSPDRFEVMVTDVYPTMTADLDTQLEAWASEMLAQALGELATAAAQSLRKAGY